MGFSSTFKNLGHYFATGAKYLSIGIADVIKFANKAQAVAPEVDALVGALAGPAAARISDLAFHALGSIAASLQPVGTDAAALAGVQTQLSSAGIVLDTQTILDIKVAALQIEAVLKAIGTTKPTA